MRLLVFVFLGLMFFTALPTCAQTPVPTATPEVYQKWTLAPSENALGTPVPSHDVVFGYVMDAGDLAISLLAGVLLFSVWAMFVYWFVINRRVK